MKKSVTVSVDSEKLSAMEMYLWQKNMKLSEELEKFAEQLYQKYVSLSYVKVEVVYRDKLLVALNEIFYFNN